MRHASEHELLTRYFDGEIEYGDLPEDLQREASDFLATMEILAAEGLRAPAGVKAGVMERLRAASEPRWRRLFERFVTPGALGLRPVTVGLGLAAAALLFVLLRPDSPDAPSRRVMLPPVVAAPARDSEPTAPADRGAPVEVAEPPVATADPSRLAGRIDDETLTGVSPILAAAARDSLPVLVLERRALEGSVKGQPAAQIVATVEQLAERLRGARALLRELDPAAEPAESEVAAAAQALEQGVPTEAVTALVEDMPGDAARAVPLALMSDLVSRGIAANEAGGVVAHLVSLRIPEARLVEIAPQMDLALRVVPQPRAALSRTLQGMGIPDAPRPTIRQEH